MNMLLMSLKRAPQFDLEYTYEKAGKYYHVVEKLVLRQDPLYDFAR